MSKLTQIFDTFDCEAECPIKGYEVHITEFGVHHYDEYDLKYCEIGNETYVLYLKNMIIDINPHNIAIINHNRRITHEIIRLLCHEFRCDVYPYDDVGMFKELSCIIEIHHTQSTELLKRLYEIAPDLEALECPLYDVMNWFNLRFNPVFIKKVVAAMISCFNYPRDTKFAFE